MHTVEWEPGLRDFLPDFSSLDRQVSFKSHFDSVFSVSKTDPNASIWGRPSILGFVFTSVHQELSEEFSSERDSLSYKQLMEQLKVRLDYVWLSAHSPSVSRF